MTLDAPPGAEVAPASVEPDPSGPPPGGRSRRRRSLGWVGAGMLAVLVISAVFAPLIARHDPTAVSGVPFSPPSGSHLLGTNDTGQDLFAQLLFGARSSLLIGTLAALLAVAVGFAVALVAGYYRGGIEAAFMRLVDLVLAFPFFVLVIVLAAFFGQSLLTTTLVIAAVIWARPARVLRSQVIKVRQFDHVVAARSMGASNLRVIGRHVLPRVAPLAAAQFVRAANVAVMIEASLAFLGLGDPGRISWGTTLYFAQVRNAVLTDAWLWWIVPPGLALTAAVIGFAFLGFAIEEWADPRLTQAVARRIPRRRRPSAASEASPTKAVLEVHDLHVEYSTPSGPLRAVDGVSLAVGRGQVVGVVGESGSGKTTLAMAVLGLLGGSGRVTSGSVVLNGRDLGLPKRAGVAWCRGRELVLVPQNAMNALNPAYTVLAQVVEACRLTREQAEATARAHEVLELVGIDAARHGAYPHELSGGMRQRAVIAMALANQPSLLVADEPVTGLDVVTQARILKLLLELRNRLGLAILIISHDLPFMARLTDELAVMYGGRIVESGPTAEVSRQPAHPYTRLLLGSFPSLRGPKRRLASITGDPLDNATGVSGCRFQPRCPDAVDRCCSCQPTLEGDGEGRRVACLVSSGEAPA
ncbi:MAG: dipeptide/oligopeptide/nickel ABC transporter permease/ATP-binding protein [Actinobacteria bacterium]|nr:dipeptide/oligopeptide/nickel ABC transporter permease/ATP-binding protein [Actinomycetota bacterium]